MRRPNLAGLAAVALALGVALGTPLFVRAGIFFSANVSKTHTGNFTVGQKGTFTVGLSLSSGDAGNDQFTVTDTLPAGLSYVTAGGGAFSCSNSSNVVTCTGVPSLTSAGQTATISVVVSAGSAASPSAVNVVTLTDSANANSASATRTARDTVTVAAATVSPTPSPTPTPTPTASPAGTSTSSSTTTSSRSSTTAITAPASGAGSDASIWAVLLVGGGLGTVIAAAAVRRRS